MGKELKYFLQSGGMFACWKPYCVATVLGSGVAVCLCDPVARVGGVSNFTLPKNKKAKEKRKHLTHSVEHSLPQLLNMMYEMGARRRNIEAHVVGGGFSQGHVTRDVGEKNVAAAKKHLKRNNITIVNEDTKGPWGRKILFNAINGEIIVYKLKSIRECDWNGDKSINH